MVVEEPYMIFLGFISLSANYDILNRALFLKDKYIELIEYSFDDGLKIYD